jgi:hypothetical protein
MMRLIQLKTAGAALVLISGLSACTELGLEDSASRPVPRPVPQLAAPTDVKIIRPARKVPKQYAAFVGKWSGTWKGGVASILVVEEVNAAGEAKGIWLWGNSPQRNDGGRWNYRARIEDGVLYWASERVRLEFKLRPDGSIEGAHFDGGIQDGEIRMTRMP